MTKEMLLWYGLCGMSWAAFNDKPLIHVLASWALLFDRLRPGSFHDKHARNSMLELRDEIHVLLIYWPFLSAMASTWATDGRLFCDHPLCAWESARGGTLWRAVCFPATAQRWFVKKWKPPMSGIWQVLLCHSVACKRLGDIMLSALGGFPTVNSRYHQSHAQLFPEPL